MNPANALTAPVTIPKIAAIIIVHNQAAELRRAITALERSAQREQLEILVVDCASDDATAEVAEEFPGITMQRLPEHFGATKALNIATRTARAEYLFLLSPDVEVSPETAARLAEKLDTEPSVTGACPLLVDGDGKPLMRTRPFPDRQSLAEVRGGGELGWTPIPDETLALERSPVLYPGREALLVRKQFVAGMNYFDERFGEYWADADLAIKIRKAGRKLEMYPAIRAIWHAPERAPNDTIHKSDRILGAAALVDKHEGFVAGVGFRMSAIFGALIRFDFALLAALLGGKKVGSQAK
jgi:N-acetylglucosaminyl-diphospho-decaprenol L-rhamnosyltransferase